MAILYIALKVIFLSTSIMYGMRCFGGLYMKQGFSQFQVLLFAVSTALFIILQWLI